MAGRLPMRVLTRTWQMLLKALEEVAAAPNAMMAAEMAVIRLTHVADLPTPEELVRRLRSMPGPVRPGKRRPRRLARRPRPARRRSRRGAAAKRSAAHGVAAGGRAARPRDRHALWPASRGSSRWSS